MFEGVSDYFQGGRVGSEVFCVEFCVFLLFFGETHDGHVPNKIELQFIAGGGLKLNLRSDSASHLAEYLFLVIFLLDDLIKLSVVVQLLPLGFSVRKWIEMETFRDIGVWFGFGRDCVSAWGHIYRIVQNDAFCVEVGKGLRGTSC